MLNASGKGCVNNESEMRLCKLAKKIVEKACSDYLAF
jgi:hypothetical protein